MGLACLIEAISGQDRRLDAYYLDKEGWRSFWSAEFSRKWKHHYNPYEKIVAYPRKSGTIAFTVLDPRMIGPPLPDLDLKSQDLAINLYTHKSLFVVENPEKPSLALWNWQGAWQRVPLDDASMYDKRDFSYVIWPPNGSAHVLYLTRNKKLRALFKRSGAQAWSQTNLPELVNADLETLDPRNRGYFVFEKRGYWLVVVGWSTEKGDDTLKTFLYELNNDLDDVFKRSTGELEQIHWSGSRPTSLTFQSDGSRLVVTKRSDHQFLGFLFLSRTNAGEYRYRVACRTPEGANQ